MAIKLSTKATKFIPKYNGNDKEAEPFSVDLAPMELGDYWELSAKFAELSGGSNGKKPEKPEEIEITNLPSMEVFKVYLQKYIKAVYGLEIDGKPATVSTLFIHASLLPYVFEIIAEMIKSSELDDTTKKK